MSIPEKPRRLGRGLEALLGANAPSAAASGSAPAQNELRKLAISQIRPNPYQPRKNFRPEDLADLESSIRSSGLLQPITVRTAPNGAGYELIAVLKAKLFARNAKVWLMDEPFNGLDPVFRAEFRHDLHLLQVASRATMLFVTHDPTDALALGRRVGVLGDGRLQQLGPSEQLRNHPSNRFVAFCLGQLSLIDGRVGGGDHSEHGFVSEWGSIVVPLTVELVSRLTTQSNPSLTLGIRPEDVLMVSPANPLGSTPGAKLVGWTVVLAEPVGSGWLLTVARERSRVRVEWRSDSPPPVGASKDWFIPAAQCLWFDGLTGQRII